MVIRARGCYGLAVNCIVTAGPTYEPVDKVRRLTNFSTGRLGTELSRFLARQGHRVRMLLGEQATYHGDPGTAEVERFSTTSDLHERLERLRGPVVDAVFHVAAVSDFVAGRVMRRLESGVLEEMTSRKISSRAGTLLVELTPAPKLISELRSWFQEALLVGWKYELDGDPADALARGQEQLKENRTDAAVVNGRAYGEGFGVLTPDGRCRHAATEEALFGELNRLLQDGPTASPSR